MFLFSYELDFVRLVTLIWYFVVFFIFIKSLFKKQCKQQSSNTIFECNNFSSKLSERLLSFSEKEQFSDICIITSDDMRFNGHKCVLSAFSDYFLVMFESGLKEATAREVKINEVNGNVFKTILTFLYTGRIEIQNDSIEDIFKAAHFFQISYLIDQCNKFLGENMNVKNCLGIAMIADHYGLTELFKKASRIASGNFETICSRSEFVKLNESQLSAIVSSDELCVTSEEVVFLNIIKWIEHDKSNRGQSTVRLLSKVRYWLLSPDFIKKNRSQLPHQVECLEMICTWLEWHSLPNKQRPKKTMKFLKPKYSNGLLFVGGGAIQTYDPELNIWTREDVGKLPKEFANIIAFKNKLIFSSTKYPLAWFDLQTQEITNFVPRMLSTLSNRGLAVLNDELYVVGGQNHRNKHSCLVEKYNFTSGKWQALAPLNNVANSPKPAVVNGQLYVVGDKSSWDKSTTMECYNPIANEWTTKSFPFELNFGFGFTAIKGDLYKIGGGYCGLRDIGSGEKGTLETIDCYNPYKNTWAERSQMKTGLAGLYSIAWNDRLIICGGVGETLGPLKLVQEYNPDLNEFRVLPPLIEYDYPNSCYGLVAFE